MQEGVILNRIVRLENAVRSLAINAETTKQVLQDVIIRLEHLASKLSIGEGEYEAFKKTFLDNIHKRPQDPPKSDLRPEVKEQADGYSIVDRRHDLSGKESN
jgi:hypothetical protein